VISFSPDIEEWWKSRKRLGFAEAHDVSHYGQVYQTPEVHEI
jgi:hypothetical protein